MDVNFSCIAPQDMCAYVEQRLDHWAHWYARGNDLGLGYPPCSIEYRLLHEGIVKTNQRGRRPIEVNESAEEIEQLITELAQQNPLMALSLRSHYFTQRSLREQAKALGISHTRLKSLVDMAKQWIVGRLSVKMVSHRVDFNTR